MTDDLLARLEKYKADLAEFGYDSPASIVELREIADGLATVLLAAQPKAPSPTPGEVEAAFARIDEEHADEQLRCVSCGCDDGHEVTCDMLKVKAALASAQQEIERLRGELATERMFRQAACAAVQEPAFTTVGYVPPPPADTNEGRGATLCEKVAAAIDKALDELPHGTGWSGMADIRYELKEAANMLRAAPTTRDD